MLSNTRLLSLALAATGLLALSSAQATEVPSVRCEASYYESPTATGGTISEKSKLEVDFKFGATVGLATELRGRHFSANLSPNDNEIKIFIVESERSTYGTMTTGYLAEEGRWSVSQVEGSVTFKLVCTRP